MILNLCRTPDNVNVINKEINIIDSVNVVLRKDFNIVDPVFYLTFVDGSSSTDYNYITLPELNRSYFVNSVELVNDKLVKFSCSVDVLESFKTNIMNSDCSFNRSIKTGDYYKGELPETTLKTVSKHESNKTFNSGISQILVSVGGYNE